MHDRADSFCPSGAQGRAMDRRRFLVTSATAAIAGCLGGTPTGSGSTAPNSTNTSSSPTDNGGAQLTDHPAAQALATQPVRGPDPPEAPGLIVAFEDPSCPTCRRFEQNVVPTIRRELIEPGDVAYVFRGYPVVYPWGEPAVRALESTYARDPAAHWALVDHYFDQQEAYRRAGVDAVYERTETFLQDETELQAGSILDEARNGLHDEAVQSDLDAGMAAGAGRTTPHLFLFRNGEFRTKTAGRVSYDTVSTVLGF